MICRSIVTSLALLIGACGIEYTADWTPEPYVQLQHPEWTRDAVIYQINTRQFSQDGTFDKVREELPRLKTLGVDILWFMPIHPIGEVNRKGSLGSPYSVKDYYGVNPEFGTLDDFRILVNSAHSHGFHVILDWVANHTSWDNNLLADHPDWYERNWRGDPHPTPWTDWSDIIDLNFESEELRRYMGAAMRYWVEDVGIDGFRVDVAGFVPLDFWEDVRKDLETVKPVFMLAEWQQRDLHRHAFDASYGWAWKEAAHSVAKGRSDAGHMTGYYADLISTWPQDAMRMLYTSNHDQNSWDGTAEEIFGDSLETFMALSFVSEGIPSIYNGQEAGLNKQLEFFEKDPIVWREHPHKDWLSKLIEVKTNHPTLHNGEWGGRTEPVTTDNPRQMLSFVRGKGSDRILALFNLSSSTASVTLTGGAVEGSWCDIMDGGQRRLGIGSKLEFEPWEWHSYEICTFGDET